MDLLTDKSHNYTCSQCKDKCIYQLNILNMPQCRDPVVHKICIRKLDGYLYILNNIVSEKGRLEKSLSSLIRRVIQLLSSTHFSIKIGCDSYQNSLSEEVLYGRMPMK